MITCQEVPWVEFYKMEEQVKRFLTIFCAVILTIVALRFDYLKMLVTGEREFRGQLITIGETIRLQSCKRWNQKLGGGGGLNYIILGPGAKIKVVGFGENKQSGSYVVITIENQGDLGKCFDEEFEDQVQSFYQKEIIERGISILVQEYLQLRIRASGGLGV